ncbi:hypothetical protein D3C76_1374630 [compost metagenome]
MFSSAIHTLLIAKSTCPWTNNCCTLSALPSCMLICIFGCSPTNRASRCGNNRLATDGTVAMLT